MEDHVGATREDAQAQRTADRPAAESPTKLPKRSWGKVLRNSVREFKDDNLTDSAAALTYYATLAIFPALLVLVALVGLAGPNTTQQLVDNLGQVVPGSARDIIVQGIQNLQRNSGAGLTAIIGLAVALWSASGYVGAFMNAANGVYDVPEGRPIWKKLPTRVALTAVLLLMMAVAALIVVFTGPVAQQAGELLGLGSAAVTVWNIAKWPVLLVIMVAIVALLYWGAPNVKHPGFRWVTPGGVVAVLLWVLASAAFAFYVANFASYNKTYGALAGVIVFLVWIWLSNLAILLGAEVDAEIERARAEAAGLPRGSEPYVDLRDDRKAKGTPTVEEQTRGAELARDQETKSELIHADQERAQQIEAERTSGVRGDGDRGDGVRGDGDRGDGVRGDGDRGDGDRGDGSRTYGERSQSNR
jgi:membrane protein